MALTLMATTRRRAKTPSTTPRRKRGRSPLQAREQLVADNLTLVHHVARKLERYLSDQVEHDELVSAGTLGLIAAARTFDVARGLKFSTYAVPRIRGAILDDLRKQDHVSRGTRRHARQLIAAKAAVAHRTGHEPTRAELAQEMGVDERTVDRWEVAVRGAQSHSIDELAEWQERSQVTVFLTSVPSEMYHGMATRRMPAVEEEDTVEAKLDRDETRRALHRALNDLPKREREVIVRSYWLDEPSAAIARDWGVTESRVSQIRARAMRHLREHFARRVAA